MVNFKALRFIHKRFPMKSNYSVLPGLIVGVQGRILRGALGASPPQVNKGAPKIEEKGKERKRKRGKERGKRRK